MLREKVFSYTWQPMTEIAERTKGVEMAPAFSRETTLGVYIQVPFCQTKCTYCNFHTGVASPAAYAPYARAVEQEIRNWRALHSAAGLESAARFSGTEAVDTTGHPEPGRILDGGEGSACESANQQQIPRHRPPSAGEPLLGMTAASQNYVLPADTVYLGGGTPSLFDPAELARILKAVRTQFGANGTRSPKFDSTNAPLETKGAAPGRTGWGERDVEVTLEADPETITGEKAAAWLGAGINRISLGAQSFHDSELKAAGRMHRHGDIFGAIDCLRSAGLGNVSLDLIAGLPHQTETSWRESVEEALRLRPEHISIYLFEVDEGSRLGRELLSGGTRYSAEAVPSDDAMAECYEFACEALARAGYEHYEISNWALPGFRSRHNLKYWRREPYLGFGAGAHSFDGHSRWANAHDPAAYAAAIEQGRLPVEQLEEVTPKQALEEELFLGLRQLEGIDLAELAKRYGAQFENGFKAALDARIHELLTQGLVEREGSRVRLAPGRLAVSNEVFVALLD